MQEYIIIKPYLLLLIYQLAYELNSSFYDALLISFSTNLESLETSLDFD